MDLSSPSVRVASLLVSRLSVRRGQPCTPSDLAGYLHHVGGVRVNLADQIAWGETPTVDHHTCGLIAKTMRLPADVLACAIAAMSAEVATETLLGACDRMPANACQCCAMLAADVVELVERTDGTVCHREIAVDVLEHVAGHPIASGVLAS
jgi:hypothetical protein